MAESIEQIKEKVTDYFGDTSRPASQTKEDLQDLADHCNLLAESIDENGDPITDDEVSEDGDNN
jgi:hypothetical protein